MSEFQEVMQQLNRMCSHYQNCEDSGCPLFDECGNIGAHCSRQKNSNRIEKTVMSWAAEHPEPEFPTWYDYLCNIGVLNGCGTSAEVLAALTELHIAPAIAERLGLSSE